LRNIASQALVLLSEGALPPPPEQLIRRNLQSVSATALAGTLFDSVIASVIAWRVVTSRDGNESGGRRGCPISLQISVDRNGWQVASAVDFRLADEQGGKIWNTI
jgi:hypothetical protein